MIRRFIFSLVMLLVVVGGAWFVWERYIDQEKVQQDIQDTRNSIAGWQERARVLSQQAQDAWAETKNKFDRMKTEVSGLEDKYGDLLKTKDDAEKAVTEGLDELKTLSQGGDVKSGALELNNVAVLQLNKGEPKAAVTRFEKAIATLEKESANPSDLAQVYLNYATALAMSDQAAEAKSAQAKAKELDASGKVSSDWIGEPGLRIYNP